MEVLNIKSNRGLTLVEVIIATSIILVFFLALFSVNNLYLKTTLLNTGNIKATLLAEEGLEAVRFLRDASWSTNIAPLSSGVNYRLKIVSDSWQLTTENIIIDSVFDRTITFSSVYRDTNGDIVSSGGVLDTNTKLVNVTVTWSRGTDISNKSISTYITNIFSN